MLLRGLMHRHYGAHIIFKMAVILPIHWRVIITLLLGSTEGTGVMSDGHAYFWLSFAVPLQSPGPVPVLTSVDFGNTNLDG